MLCVFLIFISNVALGQYSEPLDIEVNYHIIDIREMDDDDLTMYIDFHLELMWVDKAAHENKIDELDEDDPQLWILGT